MKKSMQEIVRRTCGRGIGGNDVILGGNDDDIIYGDVAWGSGYTTVDGHDYLDGGAGIDTIYGNGGDDILIGMRCRDAANDECIAHHRQYGRRGA